MMTWQELRGVINEKESSDSDFKHECVVVYDAADGEFYPADTIAFEESDGIIDAGHMFISINAEKYNE
tara:strand:- start:31 stop:234 length:204 start_codon:yes stop_codon:yes gene_type:complete